jgi:general secretion pathway protein A
MQFHLTPLDREETEAYVLHRLKVAGREALLFDLQALALLYEHSDGVPRRINIIAGNALVEGFGKGVETIGPEIIESVVKDQA